MEGKKRYIAIILFLLICLTVFTFATTGDEELENGTGNGNNVQEVTDKGSSDKDDKTESDSKEDNKSDNKDSNSNKTESEDEEDLDGTGNVDNEAWDKALSAVEDLEELLTDEQADIARELVEEITNSDQYKELMDRIEDAEDAIDAAELVEKLEQMVEEAAKKADLDDASDFRDEEVVEAIEEIDGEKLAEVKADLEKRVEELSKILDDDTAPSIEGIEDGKHTKENVGLTITDENEVTTKVTKDGNEIDFAETFTEEGTYEVTVVDAAFNEKTLTFTIDKTAPKFEGLPSREAHIDNYKVDVTDKNETTITLQKDHGKFDEIEEGHEIKEEGTYQLVALDKAGNKYTTWIIIDKTLPSITGVTNGSFVNKCENVYVFDRYLDKVVIDGKTYTRKDFTHDTKNENFNFSPEKICAEGTHTITATDRSGKSKTETFTIDKTVAVRLSADFYTNGVNAIEEIIDGKKYNVYYTNEGKVVAANIAMNEELKTMPKFTFYINGKSYNATSTRTSYDEANKKWYYHATLNITDKMEDGELTFVASEIYDKAGNKSADVAGPSNSRRVFIDQTAAKVMSTDFYVHGLTAKDKVFFTKKGVKFTVNITTNEILGNNPTFTLHNNGKDYPINKVVYRGLNDKGYYLYQADFELTNDSEMTDGEVTFTVNNIQDRAGNATAEVVKATNSRRVVIDTTAPTATPSWTNKTVEADKNATFNEFPEFTTSEEATVELISGEVKMGKPGIYKLTYRITDLAGNTNDYEVVVTVKDTKKPTATADWWEKTVEADKTATFTEFPVITPKDNAEGELKVTLKSGEVNMAKPGTYKLTYNITDESGNKATYCAKVHVVDTTAPVVTINGDSVITVQAGTKYTELGATVTDNVDADKKIDTTSPSYINLYKLAEDGKGTGAFVRRLKENEKIDTTVIGKYLIVYRTTDAAGNESNKDLLAAKRWVIVNDTIKPTLTVKPESIGTDPIYSKISFKLSDSNLVDYVLVNGNKFDVGNAKWSDANYNNIKNYLVEGENTVELFDTAGNSTTKKFTMDWTLPEVVEFKQKYESKENGRIRVTLTFSEKIQETLGQGWTKVAGEENTYTKVYYGSKTHTVEYKDLAGNKNTYTFSVDNTANRVTQTFFRGERVEGTTFYIKNGEKVQFNIGFSEKLGQDAVITIGGQTVELKYDRYFEATKSHMYYGYLEIAEDEKTMKEGELEIVISNITDEVGNPGFYYQTNGKKVLESYKNTVTTNGGKVVYDRTPNRVTQSFFRGDKVENNVYYVTNGSKIQFNIGFSEKLGKDAVITIGGKTVELKYDRYFEATKSHMYYGYIEFTAEDNFEDGYLEISISNITDPLENTGFYYQTNGKVVLESYKNVETTNHGKVFYDTTAPEVTPSYTEKTVEEDSVEEFTDFPTFEIIDNSNATVKTELIKNTVNVHKVGTYELVYKFTDLVGNTAEKTITVKVVDTTAPTITGIEDGAYYNTKDTHAIPVASDKNGAIMFIKTELGDVTLSSFLKNEKEIKLVGTYKVWAVDQFGNKSEEITIHIDPYAPKVLVLDRIENVSGAYLPIKPVILEHNLDTIKVTLDGKEIDYNYGDQLTKDGQYVMTVTDKAGNSTTVEFTMDSVAPTMMISPLTLGVVDKLDLNDIAALDNLTGNLILSEDAEFQLMKVGKNISVLDYNIPIYEYTELPEDGVIDEEGDYILIAYDKAYNLTAAKFVVDRTAPVINAEDGKFYPSLTLDVKDANLSTITVKKKGALVALPVENGYVIDEDGTYEIVAKDVVATNVVASSEEKAAHTTKVTITIDTEKPTTNVVEGGIYTTATPVVEDTNLDENTITINGNKYEGEAITAEGNYTLKAKDLAGNELVVNFEIDKTPIIISGAENNGLYNADVELEVTARDEEAVIKLDGSTIGSKYTITADGKYKVLVTDKWGNEASVEFTIDKTAPTIINPFAELTNEVGAKKDAVQSVTANVTDNLDANKTIKPTVTHSVKGNMGELSEIPVTKDYIGTYTLTYTTTDTAGNIADTLVVTVEVIVNDYVLSFVDVDGKNFTYTYGDEINIKAELYSSVLEETIDFAAEDVEIKVVEGTMKNVGTYTVTATVDTAKYPNAKVEPQVITIVKKDVTITIGKTNDKLSSITKYEFNGITNPFKVESIDGLVAGDEVTSTITYSDCDFGVGHCVAKVTLDSKNYNVTNATHEFEIIQANAKVSFQPTATENVTVENGEGIDITEFVTVNRTEGTSTGNAIAKYDGKLKDYSFEREYQVNYILIDVVAKNPTNVLIKKTPTEGKESLSTITDTINGIKSLFNSIPFIDTSKIVVDENVTDNLDSAIAEIGTSGVSKIYVTNIKEVK